MLWLFVLFLYHGEILAGLPVNVGYQIGVLGYLLFTQNHPGENLVHKHRKYKIERGVSMTRYKIHISSSEHFLSVGGL